MKKFIFMLVAMLVMATTSSFATNGYANDNRVNWNENTYVSISGAPTWSFTNQNVKFWNNVNAAGDLIVGKWLTPTTAIQLRYEFGGLEGGKCLVDHTNLTFEGVANLTNFFLGNKERKFYTTINGGCGWFHTYGTHNGLSTHHNSASAIIGLGANWNLNDAWTFNVNPTYTYLASRSISNSYIALNIGITYNINPRHTHPTRAREVELVNENRKLNNELEILKKKAGKTVEPKVVYNTETITLVDTSIVTPTIGFEFDSYEISKEQYSTLLSYVEYAKSKKDEIHIYGYADGTTGSADYNLALSQKRADAVKTFLTEHGIDSVRIYTHAKGGNALGVSETYLNRVAVIK